MKRTGSDFAALAQKPNFFTASRESTNAQASGPVPRANTQPAGSTAPSSVAPSSFDEAFGFLSPTELLKTAAATAAASEAASRSSDPPAASHPGGHSAAKTVSLKRPNASTLILVSERQRGNPVLQSIRNIPWEFADVIPDFVLGEQTCALFLSLRYHMLHPKYLYSRIGMIRSSYRSRVLICLMDLEDYQFALEQVTKISFVNQWTLICTWSKDEAARYLETYKSYENKSADLIKERTDKSDFRQQFGKCLLQVKGVNKTDVATLASTFGSLDRLIHASVEQLAVCPGLGAKKVRRLFDAFHQPFLPARTATTAVPAGAEVRRSHSEPSKASPDASPPVAEHPAPKKSLSVPSSFGDVSANDDPFDELDAKTLAMLDAVEAQGGGFVDDKADGISAQSSSGKKRPLAPSQSSSGSSPKHRKA